MAEYKKSATVVMAGLPETGKSTYLGALYHVLDSATESPISLSVLPQAREHLEGIRNRWASVESEPRTSAVSPIVNELQLKLRDRPEVLDVFWPDLGGEYFDAMVRQRTLNSEVAEILDSASAVMLFIHPDSFTQQLRIHELQQVMSAIGADAGGSLIESDEELTTPPVARDWDTMSVPGEVLVVELLQMLLGYRFEQPVSKLSIVISAWDKASSDFQSPDAFLNEKLPFLNQFLSANSSRYQFQIFGVSAFGGDPESDREKLQGEVDPTRRIQVVNRDGSDASDGILSPIQWLL